MVKFYKLFAKILRWSLENLKNQLTSSEFLSHPVEKIVFKHFSIFRPNFHQLFAKIMRWSFRYLEKKVTSGKKQLTSGQKSADFRFRSKHLLRFTSIPEIGHPVEIYKSYSHLQGFTSTLQPKSASARWRRCHFR